MRREANSECAVTVRGLVEKVYFSNGSFCVGLLKSSDGELVKFAGPMFVRENDPVVLRGRWQDHAKYGKQFSVTGVSLDLNLDPAGLARYLANDPEFKGIGPAKAELIAEAFGDDFDEIITNDPGAVASAAKLPFEAVLRVREKWLDSKNRNAAATHLAAYGLSHRQVTALIDELGDSVVAMLEENPYLLVSKVPGLGFKRVDKVARKMDTPKDDPGRIRAGIMYCIDQALDAGDCWVEYEDLLDRTNLLLVMDDLDSRDLIERQLESLIRDGALTASPYERLTVARPDMERMEQELAYTFATARMPNRHFSDEPDPLSLVRSHGPRLNAVQREAALAAICHRISLISGGAGTGKTFTIKTVVKLCRERNLSIALAAPTGKAAQRMEQMVGVPAKTIHRLLGFDGHVFAAGPGNPVDADVIIIDEFSMVDVPLAWRLFGAVDFNRTAVLLVGDHNQLPPVGPGNVLRDLVRSEAVPTVVLSRVMRQAGELKENSAAILDGEVRPTSEIEIEGRRPWYVADQFTTAMDVRRFLLLLYERVLTERLRFDVVREVQLLSPTHKGPIGTASLNIDLQQLLQSKLYGVSAPEVEEGKAPTFLLHDKVIQTRNNYKLEVMNGTLGFVRDVQPDGHLTIDFEGKRVDIAPGSPELHDLQLAYCLSIHKCQGSEFPCAIVIAHKSHEFQHHRNLLYTGVTRAQNTAIILGDHWGIQNCARKRQVDRRNTFLSFLLDRPPFHHT